MGISIAYTKRRCFCPMAVTPVNEGMADETRHKSPRLLARGLETAPLRLPLASGKVARERIIRQESPRP
jgi:hypothetical protein